MSLFINELFENPRFFAAVSVLVIFSICLHEFCHAWMALKQGDPTAADRGHLTLNPLRQMGFFSIVTFLMIGIAWGAVPVDPARMRHKYSHLLVALAGPAANLGLFVIFTVLAALLFKAEIMENCTYESKEEQDKLTATVMQNGRLNRKCVGRDAKTLMSMIGVTVPDNIRCIIFEGPKEHPLITTELMMPILGIVRAKDFDDAVEQAVIIAGGLDHHGALVLRGEGGYHIADVSVKAAVQALVVLGQVQDILPAGHHVLRGEGRAVREGDVLAQSKGPGLSSAALGPAFGQKGLGQAVVVHGDQAFIHHAVKGHNVALLGREGTNLRGAGGNHAHKKGILHIFAYGGQGHKHQTKQQAKNSFHASSSVAS